MANTNSILVDWTLYRRSTYVQAFLANRDHQANLILLVPDLHQYEKDLAATNTENANLDSIEWDVIVGNSGYRPDVEFKTHAFDVLLEVSNLDIVVALDDDITTTNYYTNHPQSKVLVTADDLNGLTP